MCLQKKSSGGKSRYTRDGFGSGQFMVGCFPVASNHHHTETLMQGRWHVLNHEAQVYGWKLHQVSSQPWMDSCYSFRVESFWLATLQSLDRCTDRSFKNTRKTPCGYGWPCIASVGYTNAGFEVQRSIFEWFFNFWVDTALAHVRWWVLPWQQYLSPGGKFLPDAMG